MLTRWNGAPVFSTFHVDEVSEVTNRFHNAQLRYAVRTKNTNSMYSFGHRIDPLSKKQMDFIRRITYIVYVHKKDVEYAKSILVEGM